MAERDQSTYEILVVDAKFINEVLAFEQGVNHLPFSEFYGKAADYTKSVIRSEAEQDLNYRQYLPSFPAIKRTGGGMLFKLYQRTKMVGESRLGGKYSITFGGHVEDDDYVGSINVASDIKKTVELNRSRERDEELRFLIGGVEMQSIDNDVSKVFFEEYGFIIDNVKQLDADGQPKPISVGEVHFALLYNLYVDESVTVEVKDPALLDKGDHKLEEIWRMHCAGEIELEPWSVILVTHYLDLINGEFFAETMRSSISPETLAAAEEALS